MRSVVVFMDDTHPVEDIMNAVRHVLGEDRSVQIYAALDEVAGKLLDVFNEADRTSELDETITWTKKPVTIEARQLVEPNMHDVYLWVESHVGSFDVNNKDGTVPSAGVSIDAETGFMIIATLEGLMQAKRGDYVIRGIQGEFYPCKPDIFEASYAKGS